MNVHYAIFLAVLLVTVAGKIGGTRNEHFGMMAAFAVCFAGLVFLVYHFS